MQNKHIDLLVVEDEEKNPYLVLAPACEAGVGCIVRFMDGATGMVVKKAFTATDSEMLDLIACMLPIFEAEAIFLPGWRKEDVDVPS